MQLRCHCGENTVRAGEMALEIGPLAAAADGCVSNPSTHMAAYNLGCLSSGTSDVLLCPQGHCTKVVYMHTGW